jgi:leucyl aminopeptidase
MKLPSLESHSGALAPDVDVHVVPVFEEDFAAGGLVERLDAATGGAIRPVAEREGFRGRPETRLSVAPLPAGMPGRVVLAGLGHAEGFGPSRRLAAAAGAARSASGHRARSVGVTVRGEGDGAVHDAGVGVSLGAYAFDRYRAREDGAPALDRAVLAFDGDAGAAGPSLERAGVVAAAVASARDLVNEPGGSLTPYALAEAARREGEAAGIEFEVLDRSALARLGAGLILGVAAAGREGPFVVRLSYRPSGAGEPDVAVVGKGITFDSGGLDLKTRESLAHMKSDMAGAAAVLAAMKVLPALGCRTAVDGWLAIADNAVGPDATRPGDVLRSLSGKTVEVADTDAEGRLVVADAMTLATRRGARRVVDLATLTGSCVVALGEEAAGVFSEDDALADAWLDAARRAGEDAWRLPVWESFKGKLKSDVADLKNIGDRWGGAIQGAVFLAAFAADRPFLHCDLAGPAWARKDHALGPKGGTGYGVRTLIELLAGRSEV